ncbi:speckle-type POZ protein-like [Tigriopus californicus]|nr:speckle-type POZ protein-like [Tigriopus californicus]
MDLNLKNIMEEPTKLLRLDHSLEICCLIEVNCGNDLVMEVTSPLDPGQSLHRRLSPKHFPDMNLVSGEVRLPCHKHMLAASSDVFMAMFSNDGHQENKSQEVLIDDVNPNALEKLLEYVHSDNIADMHGDAHELIYVADKYNMANLRTFATNYAVTTFSIENVCCFLSLGELIQLEFLTRKAFEFVIEHADEVIKSDGWKSLSQNAMKRLLELTMKFAKM